MEKYSITVPSGVKALKINRMIENHTRHPRCPGGLLLCQSAHDINVYHLGNRHVAGNGLRTMNPPTHILQNNSI